MTSQQGNVVIVTGGASGIGLGIARAFHDEGASVIVGDVRQEALDRARSTFSEQTRLGFVSVDVRDPEAVTALVASAEELFGPPAVMIANAGIVPNAPALTMEFAEWRAAIETNLTGVFLCCRAAARSMVAHQVQGRIVTMSSIASHVGRLGAAAYCASKAGVEMLTKVLAMELAEHRINVNAVAPGVIEIPERAEAGARRMNEDFRSALLKAIPEGRYGRVADVAEAVLYLCSPAAEYVRGVVVPVDGGMSTGWTHMPYSAPQPG